MPKLIIKIAGSGTPLLNEDGTIGHSLSGHMWYELVDDHGEHHSFGFMSRDYELFGPGIISKDDNVHYLNHAYSAEKTITIGEFNRLVGFGEAPKTYGFDTEYNALNNSCVDFVWSALDSAGLNPFGVDGAVSPLHNSFYMIASGLTPVHNGSLLPDWSVPAGGIFGDVPAIPILRGWGDPLVLDLDGDGVEVTKMGFGTDRSMVYFDMDNDGFAERTAWATGGDGLLALDKNGNGKIDNQGELFGNTNTLADGFLNLKQYDSNADNKITSADAQFANLRVWVDADKDG